MTARRFGLLLIVCETATFLLMNFISPLFMGLAVAPFVLPLLFVDDGMEECQHCSAQPCGSEDTSGS